MKVPSKLIAAALSAAFIFGITAINTRIMADTESGIIKELKGAELTKYANTGSSLDNMRDDNDGWKEHAEAKNERTGYTRVENGYIIFEGRQNEYLPGGHIFTTDGEPALKYTLKGLKQRQMFKIAYIINIDPASKDFGSRLLNFEVTDYCKENIAIGDDRIGPWDDENQISVPADMLGRDIQIVSSAVFVADEYGEKEIELINYSAAHYPRFDGDKINIFIPEYNAPFKVTIKAVQFVTKDTPSGVNEVNKPVTTTPPPTATEAPRTAPPETEKATEAPTSSINNNTTATAKTHSSVPPATETPPPAAGSNTPEITPPPTNASSTFAEADYTNNLETLPNKKIYTTETYIRNKNDENVIFYIIGGILLIAAVSGGLYYLLFKRKR